jgi:hypothetical protein
MNRVVTVRLSDWRKQPYFAIDAMPEGVDLPRRDMDRFDNIFVKYLNDVDNFTPVNAVGRFGRMFMTASKVNEDSYKKLSEAVKTYLDEIKYKDRADVVQALISAIITLQFNAKEKSIVEISKKLELEGSDHRYFRDFLAGQVENE